ncbi:hypothetical protein HK104_005187 [Borealophlyctis nickersoniae]|nr:hypothetical protein HK104_005187 [Borealophlyctis nickersoniae]
MQRLTKAQKDGWEDGEYGEGEEKAVDSTEGLPDTAVEPSPPVTSPRRSSRQKTKNVADSRAPETRTEEDVSDLSQDVSDGEVWRGPKRNKRSNIDFASTNYQPKGPEIDEDSTDFILTNAKSPLADPNVDWTKLFTLENFQSFSEEEQAELAALLPPEDLEGGAVRDSLFDVDEYLEQTIKRFQFQLSNGSYEPKALDESVREVEKKKLAYDEWKMENFEDVWGDKFDPEMSDAIAKFSKTLGLMNLFEGGVLLDGDELLYKKKFAMIDETIEERVKIFLDSGNISVEYDNKRHDITNPTQIETLVLNGSGLFGRNKWPNGNAWKTMGVYRDGKCLGQLSILRDDFAVREFARLGL